MTGQSITASQSTTPPNGSGPSTSTPSTRAICSSLRSVARTRINRYERGVNECDLRTAKKLADALDMPLAALYAETDEIAAAIVAIAQLPLSEQRAVVNELKARAKKR